MSLRLAATYGYVLKDSKLDPLNLQLDKTEAFSPFYACHLRENHTNVIVMVGYERWTRLAAKRG